MGQLIAKGVLLLGLLTLWAAAVYAVFSVAVQVDQALLDTPPKQPRDMSGCKYLQNRIYNELHEYNGWTCPDGSIYVRMKK